MKSIEVQLVNPTGLEALYKNMGTREDAYKTVIIDDIPDYVIGVGIVGVIDEYIKEHDLTGWEAWGYTVKKK